MEEVAVSPQGWIEFDRSNKLFSTVVLDMGVQIFPAQGLWQAVGNLIKLTHLFGLEYCIWSAPFWELLGQLFFNMPATNRDNHEVKNAFNELARGTGIQKKRAKAKRASVRPIETLELLRIT